MYNVEKNLTRLDYGQPTFFLDSKELNLVKAKLKKNEYKIYYPYPDSEKNIIYNDKLPEVILYEIKTKEILRHQDILGSIYSLNIDSSLFGDIVIINNRYFVYILKSLRNYFESNLLMIKNTHIELLELDINYLSNYHRSYEKLEFIVSSVRIDIVISAICHTGRSNIYDMIKKKEIILNYDLLKKVSYKLKDGDIFSIKRIGKFKYNGIIKSTKSGKYIISIYKYI